jgi:methionyl-tRNA formyltransferase
VVAGHEIVVVLTQPDRPAGRGLQVVASPVKRFAAAQRIEVLQPTTLKAAPEVARVRAVRPDALVVAAYGLLLPQAMLEAGRYGALNIHASLLPRWRGAAPIQRTILAGDPETGISIMQMDAGLDTGPVLAQAKIPVGAEEDSGSLHDRLAELGAEMIVDILSRLEAGGVRGAPQEEAGATYAPKIEKRETRLDWSRPAAELERAVRAFRPAPGAFALLDHEPIKLWRASVVAASGAPGAILERRQGLVVACGEQALVISELQRPGGRRQRATEYLRGHSLPSGARFE